MRRAFFFLLPFALVAAAVVLVRNGTIAVPARWNPWAPLDIAEAPNVLTRFKLARLESDPAACIAALSETSMRFRALPDRATADGCGFRNAVSITASSVSLGGALTLSCPAAVSLALWERHALQPAAERWLGRRVTRLEHFGSYACRNVYGREGAARSEHATANALDVAGFVLDDGRRGRVLDAWYADTNAGRFVREAGDGACGFFDTVLDPDYNRAHRDHLHLDRGRWHVCR